MVDKEYSRLKEYNLIIGNSFDKYQRDYNNSCIINSITSDNPHYFKE